VGQDHGGPFATGVPVDLDPVGLLQLRYRFGFSQRRPRNRVNEAVVIATIGVYGFAAETFLETLREAEVRLLLDVRQRRGVRGREYAWANSRRLQAALAEAGISYEHWPSLAPTTALRRLQYAEDARHGVGKRSRVELAPAYVEGYTREILDFADLGALVSRL